VPLFEFRCKKCGHRFEVIQKHDGRNPRKCPKCGKSGIERLPSAPAIQFKGTGWYITDYQRKGSSTNLPDHGDSDKQKKEEKKEEKKDDKKDDKKEPAKKGGKKD
jgi:putative FmdB family regulatory protein